MKLHIRDVFGWSCICAGLICLGYMVLAGWSWRVFSGLALVPIGIWFAKPYFYTLRKRSKC